MSESDSNGFKITGQLFSRRDKIKSSPDYYKEKLARDKDKGTEVFSWIWFVLIPLIVVALPFQPSYNSLLTFSKRFSYSFRCCFGNIINNRSGIYTSSHR